MNGVDTLVEWIILQAVEEITRRGSSGLIVTFALYFDHASPALSVCAETRENSDRQGAKSLDWTFDHFSKALEDGDLSQAASFNHSVSRSLSLGDFAFVNLSRQDLDPNRYGKPADGFFVSLAQGLERNRMAALQVFDPKERAVFACSTKDDEVGLVWSPPPNPMA